MKKKTSVEALKKGLTSKEGVTAMSIANTYDSYATQVLVGQGFITEAPRTGKKKRYRLALSGVLPSHEDYGSVRDELYTYSITALLDDGYSQIAELQGEVQEIVDNASEGLSATQRIQTLSETADTLSNMEAVSVPPEVEALNLKAVFLPSLSTRTGRSERFSEAVRNLETAVSALERWEHENGKDHPSFEAVDEFLGEIQEHIDEASGVEFPGMFG